jgi:hypothetical protein
MIASSVGASGAGEGPLRTRRSNVRRAEKTDDSGGAEAELITEVITSRPI